jgi:hypothetical protein
MWRTLFLSIMHELSENLNILVRCMMQLVVSA